MTSFEFIRTTIRFLEECDTAPALSALVLDLSKTFQTVFSTIAKTGDFTGNEAVRQNESVRQEVAKIRDKIVQVASKEIFVQAEQLKKAFATYIDKLHTRHLFKTNLNPSIDRFTEAYDSFLRKGYKLSHTMHLVHAANDLNNTWVNLMFTLEMTCRELETGIRIEENFDHMYILFGSDLDFGDVIQKLSAVNEIYSELCNLMGISLSDYPLGIVKLESGTLWLKIQGAFKAVKLMRDIMGSYFEAVYRTYRSGAGLQSIPKGVEAVDGILQLAQKLESEGIDISKIKHDIKKSTRTLSSRLLILMQGQAMIEMDNVPYSIKKALELQFIEETKKLRLPAPSEDDHTENS